MDLTGKIILVTGASSGIGRETAILLNNLGANIVMVARNSVELQKTADLLDKKNAYYVEPFDLNKLSAIQEWMKNIALKIGTIHGLVHCAGIRTTMPLKNIDDDIMQATMDINVNAAIFLAKAFRQKGVCSHGGSLVYLSSVLGLCGESGVVTYAASKGAIIALTKALAIELVRDKIRVNCVSPGVVKTEMVNKIISSLTAEQFQQIVTKHPLGLGEAIDVANAIAFLLADCSKWITGSNLIVDGGYTAK